MQYEIFDIDGEKNIKWIGVETCGISRGHFVQWTKRKDSFMNIENKIESKNPIFKANSMACLLDECDIRLHDITLDVYKELQNVRFYVNELKLQDGSKLFCTRMFVQSKS